jgi:hypothetical protein
MLWVLKVSAMVSEFKGSSMHIFFCFCESVDLVCCYTTLVHCYEKKAVMVINYNNINKTNNHLSSCLNSLNT